MHTTHLHDGTEVYCIRSAEAKVLDYHIQGYLQHGIHISSGDIVFDVGANIGIFGIRTLLQFPDSQVFAFEPVPTIYDVLAKNAERFGGRFQVFKIGIGKEESQQTFQYYPNSPALSTAHPEVWDEHPEDLQKATLSQIRNAPPAFALLRYLPAFVAKWVAKSLRNKPVSFSCQIKTLSQIIQAHNVQRIDLLKVDCEGAEYDVLQGIEAKDWDKIGQVVAEVYNADGRVAKVKKLLEGKGFTRITVKEDDAVGGANLYNVFALRS